MSRHEVWCHTCDCQMVKREGKYGVFYGCTGFPKCFNTLNLRDAEIQIEAEDENRDEIGRPLDIDKDYETP